MLRQLVLVASLLALPAAWTAPLSVLQHERLPLAADLTRLAQDSTGDPRLPFPSVQELAAIKKVAETLIMLGQEVIPSIIGEFPPGIMGSTTEIPNDTVIKD